MLTKKHTPPRRRVLLILGVYYPELHAGIARYARDSHWELNTLYNIGGKTPAWWRGDGIIGLITTPRDVLAVRQYPKLPLVDISKGWISNSMPPRYRSYGMAVPRVLYDNVGIARLAADHFIRRGYKHVAFFNIGNYWMETEQREEFLRVTQEAHVIVHDIPYYRHFPPSAAHTNPQAEAAHRWLCQALKALPKPIGVFAGTDDSSSLVLSACENANINVPADVAILGHGNDQFICENAAVPFSSVDVNLFSLGYEASRLLDRLMNGNPPPTTPIIIPPKEVVSRMSTHILAVPHPKVARALQFIWEHYKETIQVGHVVTASGLSRRQLEKAFFQHIHRTISGEITNQRIAQARHLLSTTTLKNQEIAKLSGFSTHLHLSQSFKRITGQSPREFRKALKGKDPSVNG